MKARVGAYAGYQLRDFVVGRAIFIVLVTSAITWAYAAATGLTLAIFDASGGLEGRDQLQRTAEFVVVTFAFVAAAVAAQGLVARDRSRGYDRVVFSRRLTPARYYLQGFVLAGAASSVLACVGSQLYGAAVHSLSLAGVAAVVVMAWFVAGGLAFLLSTLTRLHVLLLVLIVGADLALDRYVSGLSGVARIVMEGAQYALPPAHVIVALREPLLRGVGADPRLFVWPVVYGVLAILAAVVILRRRPLSS